MSLSRKEIEDRVARVSWYHRIQLAPGLVTPGTNDSAEALRRLDLPADCRGQRVLDIGTRDGFFAFEMERRGAEVLAVDHVSRTESGFDTAAAILGSRVTYSQENIYELTPERLGTFDVILCLGLIYHVPDPLGALDIVRSLCRGALYLESHVIDEACQLPNGHIVKLASVAGVLAATPLAQFYPRGSFQADPTNYWGLNMACLEAMLVESRFEVVRRDHVSSRGIFVCHPVADLDRLRATARARGRPAPGF